MHATVNQNCVGCSMCATICPEVFTMGADGRACGGDFDSTLLDAAQEARNNCPVSAISLE